MLRHAALMTRGFLVGLICWSVSGAVGGQEVMTEMEPVVVTAGRSEKGGGTVPYRTAVVDIEEFWEQGYQTVPEALGDVPGVMVQKTTPAHGSPFIRGFTGRQNLMLIDGIRFNNSLFRGGPVQYWNTIDPYSLQRIELVKGQGSVWYGSDALGGTVNAITRGSGYEGRSGDFLGGSIQGRFDGGSRSVVGRLETEMGVGGRYGLSAGLTWKDFGDLRAPGVGTMRGTGYEEWAFDIKFELAVGDEGELVVYHSQLVQDDISRWHSTINNPGWKKGRHETDPGRFLRRDLEQQRSLSYAALSGRFGWWEGSRYDLTASYQRSEDLEEQVRTLDDRRLQQSEVETYGLAGQLELEGGWGQTGVGFDLYHDRVGSSGARNGRVRPDARPVADDSNYTTLGLFGKFDWEVVEGFTVSGGVRYSHIWAELGRLFDSELGRDVSAQEEWGDVVGSARGVWDLGGGIGLFGGVSQGFRAPNLDDLSGNVTARSGVTVMGRADLEPERTTSYEAGVQYDGEVWGGSLSGNYTAAEGLIVGVPVAQGAGDLISANAGDGAIWGIELEGRLKLLEGWELRGHASWYEGELEVEQWLGGASRKEPVSRLIPPTAMVALRWESDDGRLWGEGRVRAALRADRLTEADRNDRQRIPSFGTPGYVVAGLGGGWEIVDGLDLTMDIENLFNESYRIHGSGQNQPGVHLQVGVRYRW